VWFESLQSLAQVLSDENRVLLKIIEEQKPKSIKALEELTGRKSSNLSRTLHTLADYGIVDLLNQRTKELTPVVKAYRFTIELGPPLESKKRRSTITNLQVAL
jgi:predicted transcriptional regulator